MENVIKLSKPLMVNGSPISELKYDIDEVTAENLCEADARSSTGLASRGIQNMNLAEFNTSLHFYLGCFAIIACDSRIDIEDLKRIKGRDSNKIRKIGQGFFTDTATEEEETALMEKPSDDSSEAIAEFTEKAPRLLDDSE